MKNYRLKCTTVFFLSVLLIGATVQSQTPYYMAAPEGYAAGVTGGGTPTSSNTETVTSASALSAALSGSKSVLLVSGSITTSRIKCSASNKSIIGLPGAKLINLNQTKDGSGILHLSSGSNLVIRNITFVGPGAYDADGWDLITNKGCTKLWVDHCEFQDGMDGNFDNTKTADDITISWCKFTYLKPPRAGGSGGANDHRFTNLVGGSDSDVPADGKYSITWLNCWWASGCVDRMIRGRNAQNDMLNCYWNSSVASKNIHLSPGTNGTYIYVENGVFNCSGAIVDFEKTGNNNVRFVNCSRGGSNTGSVSAPAYSWSKTPVTDVVSRVTKANCGAGATLAVTAQGEVSSSCTPVAASEKALTKKREAFRPIGSGADFIFPAACSENAGLALYSLCGRKVFTASGKSGQRVVLQGLGAGVYTARVRDGNRSSTYTFVRN